MAVYDAEAAPEAGKLVIERRRRLRRWLVERRRRCGLVVAGEARGGEEWWQIPPSEYVAHAAQHAIARARSGGLEEGVYGAPRRVEGQDGGQR